MNSVEQTQLEEVKRQVEDQGKMLRDIHLIIVGDEVKNKPGLGERMRIVESEQANTKKWSFTAVGAAVVALITIAVNKMVGH